MRSRRIACALFVSLLSAPLAAQAPAEAPATAGQLIPPPAWAYNDLACAPSALIDRQAADRDPSLRVVGVQDTAFRDLLGPGDVLVISGGSSAGLQAGQRYFVRRRVASLTDDRLPPTIHTSGWIQILGVDAAVATATVLHACEGILVDDYLEPFVAPTIAAQPMPGTVPQYENMGRILTGIDGVYTAGAGNFMTIDRGTNAGVAVGQRFLVFRDKRNQQIETTGRSRTFAQIAPRPPLVEVGEVLVVAVRPSDSTVKVTASKDAVATGDLIAPIR